MSRRHTQKNVQCSHFKRIYTHLEISHGIFNSQFEELLANHLVHNMNAHMNVWWPTTRGPKHLKGIKKHLRSWHFGNIADPKKLKYVDVTRTSIGCVDPRLDIPIASSPGGDIGEFVYALTSYEKVYDIKLTKREISDAFHHIISNRRTSESPFFICNDKKSINNLRRVTGIHDP